MSYEATITYNDRLNRYRSLKDRRLQLADQVSKWETERAAIFSLSNSAEQTEVAAERAAFIQQL